MVDAPVPTVFKLDFHIVLETYSIQREEKDARLILSPSFETDRCHLGEVSTDDDGKLCPHVYNFNLKERRDSIL